MKNFPLNRLTNMVDAVGTTVYTYTSGGELYIEDGPFASDTVTNIYSSRLRVGLALQQPTGLWTNGFGYDEAKRLTNVVSSAGSFAYTYDAMALREVDALALPNGSAITNLYDANARLLGTWLKTSGGTLLDAAGYGFDPFGNTLTSSGPFATTNSCRFSSREYLANVSASYYLHRFYSPAWQRWLNRDPMGELGVTSSNYQIKGRPLQTGLKTPVLCGAQ